MYVPHSRVPPNYTNASCGFALTASPQCIESSTPEGGTQVSITTPSFSSFSLLTTRSFSTLLRFTYCIQNGKTRTDDGSPNKPSKNRQGVGIVPDRDWWVGGIAREQRILLLSSRKVLSRSLLFGFGYFRTQHHHHILFTKLLLLLIINCFG